MYRNLIRETLARLGRIGAAPHHVEAWMRLEHGTLDGMSPSEFAREVLEALKCIDASTPAENEDLARSYGMRGDR
jgi:hypothetical protein